MGIHTANFEDGAFLYDSVTMRPLNLPAFADAEEADSFLAYVARDSRDPRSIPALDLDDLHTAWVNEAKCDGCKHVLTDTDIAPVCGKCRPECDHEDCWKPATVSRGRLDLCAEHAKAGT